MCKELEVRAFLASLEACYAYRILIIGTELVKGWGETAEKMRLVRLARARYQCFITNYLWKKE